MKKPKFIGHRLRVRKKFLSSLGKELHDYELLEILLFASNPRKDTKNLAKELIKKFDNLQSLIKADIDELKETDGVGDSTIVSIKIINEIIARILKNSASNKPILENLEDIINYSKFLLNNLKKEVFYIFFLDKKYQLISEMSFFGENDEVFIDQQKIVKKALIFSSSFVIMIHNHPNKNLRPSFADIKTTNEIAGLLKNFNINILDHLIISQNKYFSFKENGMI
jgi:DNA repair protein RadC